MKFNKWKLYIKNWKSYLQLFVDSYFNILALYVGKLLPINKRKVYVSNFEGLGFGCNPKAIVLSLHSLDPSLLIVWQVKEYSLEFPKWIKQVRILSFMSYIHMATSHIWIDNYRKPIYINKRKEQYYMQTWHGYNGLKKAEGDSIDVLSIEYVKVAKHDSNMINLFLSNGKFFTDTIRRAFWYNGEVLESGSPRCDILYKTGSNNYSIHEFYGIDKDVSIILYAPTFRKNWVNVYNIDFKRIVCAFQERFEKKCVVLFRLHPGIRNLNYASNIESVIDVSLYPDMYELMAESDYFISDYSSTLFEFAGTYKPTFIYASDVDSYINDRGFHFDLNNLPIPVCRNNDELISNILKYDYKYSREAIRQFMERVGICETKQASNIVAKKIVEICHTK